MTHSCVIRPQQINAIALEKCSYMENENFIDWEYFFRILMKRKCPTYVVNLPNNTKPFPTPMFVDRHQLQHLPLGIGELTGCICFWPTLVGELHIYNRARRSFITKIFALSPKTLKHQPRQLIGETKWQITNNQTYVKERRRKILSIKTQKVKIKPDIICRAYI